LSLDQDAILRANISDSLLLKCGEPNDLKTVIDYQPTEPDADVKTWMQFAIDEFIPPKPATLNWNGLTTRLIDYTGEMYGYGWIADTETRDYYRSRLNSLKMEIQAGDMGQACSSVNTLLAKMEQDLEESAITIEGYKFLHYYTIYIKEEMEQMFGACL
ncbi:MAG: hypothetical protein ACHQLA_04555, partial [Ignavibacteriales bacterium]